MNTSQARSTTPRRLSSIAYVKWRLLVGALFLGMLVAAPSAEAYVYWTSANSANSEVGRANLDGGGVKPALVTGAYFAAGTASDGSHVYWGNSGNGSSAQGSVGRATVDGVAAGAFQNAGTFCGLFDVQVDATNLYWLKNDCSGHFEINRAPKTGGSGGTEVAFANQICGFAIDGTHLYWSTGQYIARSLLNGSSPQPTWLNLGAGISPCGLAVDAGHIYWTQVLGSPTFRGTSIGRAAINGDPASVNNSFITGATFTGNPPSAIAVDGSHIYWINNPAIGHTTGSIGRANLDGTVVNQVFVPNVFNPDGIAVDSLGPGGKPAIPNTKIAKTKISSKKGKATFTFSAIRRATGFQCALVKKRKGRASKPKFHACTSPKTYQHLSPAKYIFEVRAVGAAGHDPSPAQKKFSIT